MQPKGPQKAVEVLKMINKTSVILSMLLGVPLLGVSAATRSATPDRFSLQPVDATMTADEYQDACRNNQQHIRKFIESYSENTLASWGVPKKGIGVLGAVAGAAVTQQATLYLNSDKSLAIDVQDMAQDDRAIFFAIKHSW